MASNLAYHQPIGSVQSKNGSVPLTVALPQKAGQTFKPGTPVQVNAGYVQAWDGATLAGAIAGFSFGGGANLATNGAGAPFGFNQIGPPGGSPTYGSVGNQPSAVNIPIGAPTVTGRSLFESSTDDTIFEATFDNSNFTNAASITPTVAMIGTEFGLTIDANGQWYVDNNKTTSGTNTVVVLTGINPIDMASAAAGIANARVYFQVKPAARQVYA